MCALPWAFAEYQQDGTVPMRDGNRRVYTVIHDCFSCVGVEQYVAVSCKTAPEAERLSRLIGFAGNSVLRESESSGTGESGSLAAAVAAWCRARTKHEAFHTLQAAGVTAAPLLDVSEIDANPHLAARGFFRTIVTAAGFPQRAMTYGFRFVRNPLELNTRAPRFGQHNADVLRSLGLDADEIAEALRTGVIADRPTAQFVPTVLTEVQQNRP